MPATLRARSFAALPVLLVVALLGSMLTAPPASAATRKQRISHAFSIVSDQRGDWYRYGAAGPNRFDCSGLVYFAYRKAGFKVPRTSSAQAAHMRRIKKSDLRRGDFVYFYSGSASARNVYHLGVFAGWNNGRRYIVHSPRTGERVQRSPIWTSKWFAGTLREM